MGFWTGMLIGWCGGLINLTLALYVIDRAKNCTFDHTHFD